MRKTPLKRRKRGDDVQELIATGKVDTALRVATEAERRKAKRRAEAFERDFGGTARLRWIQMQPCCVCGGWPSEAAHAKSRGAGGTAEDMVPMCTRHHREQHDTGIETFQERHGVNLAEIAAKYAGRWWDREVGS